MPAERLGKVWFEIVREPWNEYIIKDKEDVILNGRLVVTKLSKLQDPDTGKPGIRMASQSIFVTYAPASLRDNPSETLPGPGEIPDEKKERLEVKIIKEDWNVYRLPEEKVTFKARLIVGEVFRVADRFAPDGDPYYIVESTGIVELRKD